MSASTISGDRGEGTTNGYPAPKSGESMVHRSLADEAADVRLLLYLAERSQTQ
jgi:hypothetical protein